MNRHYWYYRFKADTTWLLNFIDDIEQSDRDFITSLTSTLGVASGFNVTERGAGQNFSVDISSGVGYDKAGQRFFSAGTINVPFIEDEAGNPITVSGAGNSKIVAVYADYALVDDPGSTVVDGFGDTVFTVATEEVAYKLYQGTEAVSPTPPAAPVGNMVLLAYVTIHFNDLTISNADINNSVKEYLSIVIGPNVVGENEIDWGFGPNQVSAIDVPIADAGNLYTATEVENALQEVMGVANSALNQINAFTYTGTGAIVRQNSPTINTPTLNTPVITVFSSMQHSHLSAAQGGNLSGNAITTVITGTGNVVKATSPTLTTPTLTNATLTSPNIAFNDWTDANHSHLSAGSGGALDGSAIQTNITGTGAVVKSNNGTLNTPTLTTPIIGNFTNAQHNHSSAAQGGALAQAAVTVHQAALSILETQIVDGTLLSRNAGNETITGNWQVTQTSNPTTDGNIRRQSFAKAYVRGNTTAGTITHSYNVTSVTKTGTGRATVAITNPFNSATESVVQCTPAYVVNSVGLMATIALFDATNIDVNIHDHTNAQVDTAFNLTAHGNLG